MPPFNRVEPSPRPTKPIVAQPRIPQPLKWHGGKFYLAKQIVEMMPRHIHYCEPYAGGLAVLLAKSSAHSEVVNDLNKDLINFWSVLQGLDTFAQFQRLCEATPFSQELWENTHAELQAHPDPIETSGPEDRVTRAWRFFIHCRQSLAGRMRSFTGITKTRLRRGMNNEVSAWLSAVEGLPEVHARLKRVLILNMPALDVIKSQDGPYTLFYCDCPYLHSTRSGKKDYNIHEMSNNDHKRLLSRLSTVKGKFLLSGYPSDLYDEAAAKHGWRLHTFNLPNNAASGTTKRRMTECIWTNY